jgi:hypothetical protein
MAEEVLHPDLAGLQVEQAPDIQSAEQTDDTAIDSGASSHQAPSAMTEAAQNAREGKGPNAAGDTTASTAEKSVPSDAEPFASTLPSANTPDPAVANPQVNPNAATEKSSIPE